MCPVTILVNMLQDVKNEKAFLLFSMLQEVLHNDVLKLDRNTKSCQKLTLKCCQNKIIYKIKTSKFELSVQNYIVWMEINFRGEMDSV